uniref:Glomulin, FKBP associated protein n=1 Tax=Naja naja TaxID=35670 RepID=A0A8C6VDP9_NAJNA
MAKELQEIIQRCQFLDEENFKGEDYNLFQVAGQKCFEEGNIAEVLEIVQNEKNVVIIKNMGWSLIGPLLRCMLKQEQDDVERQYCMKILDKLVELCSAKELILGFLEQIEQASREQTSAAILLLLKSLQEALLKLDTKKAYSVGLSLSTILSQLSLLPIPYTKEQLQEDQHGLCQCLNALPQFVRPFVLEIVQHTEIISGGNCNDLKEELLGFCLKSLKHPLLMAELDPLPEEMAENPLRQFAAEIVRILADIRELFPQVRFQPACKSENWDDEDISEMDKQQSSDALACLTYIILVQDCFGVDCLPVVFNPSYILQCNMVHIRGLLKRTEEPVLLKGLDLVKIMTQCPFESLRKKSLKILQLYLDKFDEEGKYILFRCLLKTSNHSGVEGHIIQNIKNQIDLSLKREEGSKFFTGLQLISLLDMVLSLPEGAETDLLQHSDRIMASLNLLRYLLIKDNEDDNKTCIWTELYKIERNFLKPLHTGLNMSRAHYEAEIKRKKENKIAEPHSSKKTCSQLIAKAKMSGITKDMELQALHSAVFTFDLMKSVLARVEELIENKGCN